MSQTARQTSLFRSTAVMTLGTLLSRITGVGRTIALAYALGLFPLADAYNQANQTPTMLYELVVGGILSATLIPVFVRQFRTDEDEGWKAVSAVLTIVLAAVGLLSVLVALGAGNIIDFYLAKRHGALAADQKAVATFLLRLFAAQVALYGFISVATALLNVRRRFGPPMFAPIFNNLVLICLFVALPRFFNNLHEVNVTDDRVLLTILGIGTTAGVAAMALVLVPFVRTESKGRLRLHWEPKHSAVRAVIKLSGWTAGFVVANQICLAVNLVLAGSHVGDTTAMLTSYTFFILPHGIYAVSVMSALQPALAEAWADSNIALYRKRFVEGVRLILFAIVPAAVGYVLLTSEIVQAVLLRGSFDAAAASRTTDVLALMVIGLPGFSLFIYCSRALQAITDAKAVFWLYVLENAVNIALAVVLYQSLGVQGLALAQSIAYLIGAAAAISVVRNRSQGLQLRNLLDGTARIVAATIPMAAVVYFTKAYVNLAPAFTLVIAVVLGALTYAVAAWLCRIPEFRQFTKRFSNVWKSR